MKDGIHLETNHHHGTMQDSVESFVNGTCSQRVDTSKKILSIGAKVVLPKMFCH